MSPFLHSGFGKKPLSFRWEQIINCVRVDVRPNSLFCFSVLPSERWVPGALLWIRSLSLSAPLLLLEPTPFCSPFSRPHVSSTCLLVCLSVLTPLSVLLSCMHCSWLVILSLWCVLSSHHNQNCWQSPETFSQTTVCLLSSDTLAPFRWHDITFVFWFTSQLNDRMTPNLSVHLRCLLTTSIYMKLSQYSTSVCPQLTSPPPFLASPKLFNKNTTPSCLSQIHRKKAPWFFSWSFPLIHSDTNPLSSAYLTSPLLCPLYTYPLPPLVQTVAVFT